MSRHDDLVRLRHMLDHSREAVAMLAGQTRELLNQDRVLQLALTRLVEVVGEAAARVSPEGQAQYPSIPWKPAIGMRNRLIHGYDVIDLGILWDTVTMDLPRLIGLLEQVVPISSEPKPDAS